MKIRCSILGFFFGWQASCRRVLSDSLRERERERERVDMADEQTPASGRHQSRGADSSAWSSALECLKALRQGDGRQSKADGGFQIKMETPIYDTVGEDEYDALVAKRREEARGFIVDDNGLGYDDEGEEKDWSKSELKKIKKLKNHISLGLKKHIYLY
jgi:hypothetical protein